MPLKSIAAMCENFKSESRPLVAMDVSSNLIQGNCPENLISRRQILKSAENIFDTEDHGQLRNSATTGSQKTHRHHEQQTPHPQQHSQQTQPPSSLVILHRIASYLSLGDAESMTSLTRPSPHTTYSAVPSAHSAATSILLPGYHSLDLHFYHGSSPALGVWVGASHHHANLGAESHHSQHQHYTQQQHRQYQQHHHQQQHILSNHNLLPPFQQQLSSIMDSNDELDEPNGVDDEDWFVGGRQQSGSSTTPATPALVALSPLEEEWDAEERLERVWTPAGQATCESERECCDARTMAVDAGGVEGNNETGRIGGDSEAGRIRGTCGNEGKPNLEQDHDRTYKQERDNNDDASFFLRREHRQRKQALQLKLAAAVFAHPYPLRSYCLDAYATALKLSRRRQKQLEEEQRRSGQGVTPQHQRQQRELQRLQAPPETTLRDRPLSPPSPSSRLHGPEISPELGEHSGCTQSQVVMPHHLTRPSYYNQQQHRQQKLYRSKILRILLSKLLQSAPLSILMDLLESTFDLSVDTLFAMARIGTVTLQKCISLLSHAIIHILDILSRINPFYIVEFVMNAQRSAVGKTSEVLVSGIQSVATGVGSASSAALNRLSRQGLALAGGVVGGSGATGLSRSGGTVGSGGLGRRKDVGIGDNRLDSKVRR